MNRKINELLQIGKIVQSPPAMELTSYTPPLPDDRTRAERLEDFEKELATLDKRGLENLLETIQELDEDLDSESKEVLWRCLSILLQLFSTQLFLISPLEGSD